MIIAEERKTRGIIRRDTRANQPSAVDVLWGTLYYVTDESVIERSNGLIWESFSSAVGTSPPFAQSDITGLVTALGAKLESPVNLTTQVTAVLPTANGGNSVNIASAALPLGSGQITFPATQNASADVNTLDDYEEGTWTPVINYNDGAAVGVTYSVQTGEYIKIGRTITVSGQITLTNKGSSVGWPGIGGFPFTIAAGRYFNPLLLVSQMAGLTSPVTGLLLGGTITMRLYDSDAVGAVLLDQANLTNTSQFFFSVTYFN